jgi:endonuclease YncB( thermonuclease family)
MTGLTRRSMLAGAAALAAAPARPDFFDGQTVVAGGAERVLTDIVAPSSSPLHGRSEPGADISLRALQELLVAHAPLPGARSPLDRWGRAMGPALFVGADGRQLSLQIALLEAGAARVSPQSDDDALLDAYYAAEETARAARRGIWALATYAIRDVSDERGANGFQIYRGAIRSTDERRDRVYFNFGDDFRTDVTATVTKSAFRRWRRRDLFPSFAGMSVEVRGLVEWINGPSILLRHERQLRFL